MRRMSFRGSFRWNSHLEGGSFIPDRGLIMAKQIQGVARKKEEVIADCRLTALRSIRGAILAARVGAEEGDEFLEELAEKLKELDGAFSDYWLLPLIAKQREE